MKKIMVDVFDDGTIITRVEYNNDLDNWDGHDFSSGRGRHKGITKLKDGRYVLIHGADWSDWDNNDEYYGEIISKDDAIQEILKAYHEKLIINY